MRTTEAFDEFVTAQKVRKLSPATFTAWRSDFAILMRLGRWSDVSSITKQSLRAAFGTFADDHADASVRRMWSSWNAFLDWLVAEDIVDGNPMRAIQPPRRKKDTAKLLDYEDLEERLYAAADAAGPKRNYSRWPARDLALIATFLGTGCRLGEAAAMGPMDIRGPFLEPYVLLHGKGGDDRIVPVEPQYVALTVAWNDERVVRFPRTKLNDENTPLWVHSVTGERLTHRQIDYLVKDIYRRAGVVPPKGAVTHAMRHTFATNAVADGATVVEVKELLGHSSLDTTQRYLSARGSELRETVRTHKSQVALRKHLAGKAS